MVDMADLVLEDDAHDLGIGYRRSLRLRIRPGEIVIGVVVAIGEAGCLGDRARAAMIEVDLVISEQLRAHQRHAELGMLVAPPIPELRAGRARRTLEGE